MRAKSKLAVEAEGLISDEENVIGAFAAFSGPRPGIEAFSVLAFGALLAVTSSYLWAIPVAVAAFVGVSVSRRRWTIALTDRNLLVIGRSGGLLSRSKSIVERLPADALRAPGDSRGDRHITVGHQKYWVMGASEDEARRLARRTTI